MTASSLGATAGVLATVRLSIEARLCYIWSCSSGGRQLDLAARQRAGQPCSQDLGDKLWIRRGHCAIAADTFHASTSGPTGSPNMDRPRAAGPATRPVSRISPASMACVFTSPGRRAAPELPGNCLLRAESDVAMRARGFSARCDHAVDNLWIRRVRGEPYELAAR